MQLPALLLAMKLADLAIELAQLAAKLDHSLHRLAVARFFLRPMLCLGCIARTATARLGR